MTGPEGARFFTKHWTPAPTTPVRAAVLFVHGQVRTHPHTHHASGLTSAPAQTASSSESSGTTMSSQSMPKTGSPSLPSTSAASPHLLPKSVDFPALTQLPLAGFGKTATYTPKHSQGVTSWPQQFADIDFFLSHVLQLYPNVPVYLYGQSTSHQLVLRETAVQGPPPFPDLLRENMQQATRWAERSSSLTALAPRLTPT